MDKTHQNRSSPQKHKCPYCEIEYCTKANMKRHVKSIHESSLYSCTLCKKSFMYSGNRNRHLKNCHQNTIKGFGDAAHDFDEDFLGNGPEGPDGGPGLDLHNATEKESKYEAEHQKVLNNYLFYVNLT